jgi:ribonuclease Z
LRVGREMGAKRILLTHFSQRYQKIPGGGDAGVGAKPAPEEGAGLEEAAQINVEASGENDGVVFEGGVPVTPGTERATEGSGRAPSSTDMKGEEQIAIVAFDYMRCKIGDFIKMAAFRPALLKLYEEKED